MLDCTSSLSHRQVQVLRNFVSFRQKSGWNFEHPCFTAASTTSTTTLSSSTTATTTTESEPEETTTSLEDDYYGDYSGDEYDYDYGDNEVDDDYDPAEYGAAIANEPPSDEPKGSIIDLIDFDSYEDDYDYGDQEEREGKKIGGGKSPDKMTVNDVLEYVDEMMKDVPLDDDEYYDYLEKATTRYREFPIVCN